MRKVTNRLLELKNKTYVKKPIREFSKCLHKGNTLKVLNILQDAVFRQVIASLHCFIPLVAGVPFCYHLCLLSCFE